MAMKRFRNTCPTTIQNSKWKTIAKPEPQPFGPKIFVGSRPASTIFWSSSSSTHQNKIEYGLADSNMIEFQASPVAHLNSVRNEFPKLQKLACLFIASVSARSINANCDIPIIENMKMKRIRRRARDAIAGNEPIKVLKIVVKL